MAGLAVSRYSGPDAGFDIVARLCPDREQHGWAGTWLLAGGSHRNRLLRLEKKPGDGCADGEIAVRRDRRRADRAAADDFSSNSVDCLRLAGPTLGTCNQFEAFELGRVTA